MASVDLAVVRSLLAGMETFRSRSLRISSMYAGHNEEKCFRVEIDDETRVYKVRFATATSKLSVATEHEAIRTLRCHGIEWTPEVFEFQLADPAYLVVGYIEGESLDRSVNWVKHAESIVTAIGRLLADMHEITGDYFGHLAGPRYSSWRTFVDLRFWRHVLPLVRAGLINEEDLRRIRLLYEEASEDFGSVRPALLHGDVKPANIVFDSDRGTTMLVDFELARFGDVDFEWSKLQRLALRWPAYRRLIARPLLAASPLARWQEGLQNAKLLIYALYHTCSFLDFELETGLTSPAYRIGDLAEVVQAVRSRGRSV